MDGPGHIPCSVMVGSGTCLHPAGVGGIQFTMTPCTGETRGTILGPYVRHTCDKFIRAPGDGDEDEKGV